MAKIELKNQKGEVLKTVELADEVFGIEPHKQAVYDTVLSERAHMRQGTHSTLTRTEVSGGGRKPWRQKGTGRARQGSTRAPQWRHGGVAFGPTPHKYAVSVNKKVVKLAMKSVLSSALKEGNLILIDDINLDSKKTKGFVEVLEALKVTDKKIIIATPTPDANLLFASGNIASVLVQTPAHLSVYDILLANVLILTEKAAKEFEEVLK